MLLALAAAYVPRRPPDTVLRRLVREHDAPFVAHIEPTYAPPLPRYMTDAFERLACGDFSRAFVRCNGDTFRHDVIVFFSCNPRGLCPSCGARRMCDEARGITDCILANASVRPWVLRLPFALPRPLRDEAGRPHRAGAHLRRGCRSRHEAPGWHRRRGGGLRLFPHCFGGSLHWNVLSHLVSLDAVFDKLGEGVRLHEAPPPAKTDIAGVGRRVHDRALVFLRSHRTLTSAPREGPR